MFSSLLLCRSADAPATKIPSDWDCMQKVLRMDAAIDAQPELVRLQLFNKSDIENDVTSIRCVKCDEGRVRVILWQSPRRALRKTLLLDLDWMPPLTECVHLDTYDLVTDLQTARLSRNLRYLCLRQVRMTRASINLRTLPARMEELHMVGTGLRGTLDVTQLPITMTHMTFGYIWVQDMLVCNASLPARLQSIKVKSYDKKFKFHAIGSKKCDERVSVGGKIETPRFLRYTQRVQVIMKTIVYTN